MLVNLPGENDKIIGKLGQFSDVEDCDIFRFLIPSQPGYLQRQILALGVFSLLLSRRKALSLLLFQLFIIQTQDQGDVNINQRGIRLY